MVVNPYLLLDFLEVVFRLSDQLVLVLILIQNTLFQIIRSAFGRSDFFRSDLELRFEGPVFVPEMHELKNQDLDPESTCVSSYWTVA